MSKQEEKLWTDFQQAIQDGNEDQVRRILCLGGRASNFLTRKISKTQGTLTALHLAVKHGKENVIKLLLERGANVNATGHHGCTALHIAVDKDDERIIQLLLSQKDIDVDKTDEYGHTAIKLAAGKGNLQTVKMLIEKGADTTKADSVDNTAIHVAAVKGHYEVLQLLLEKAVAQNPGIIGKQNKDSNTPLHLAVSRGCQNSVALLLRYGAAASLELRNRLSETPKQLATGNKAIMELLENPAKALQTRPVVKQIGRGVSVEADSGHNPVPEHIPLPTNALFPTGLPQVVLLTASHVTINNEFNTEVGDGGCAAIGPWSELHTGQAPVMPRVRPQPPSTAESSYKVNVSGGSASIGDHSVTYVGTPTPRTPDTAESLDAAPFQFSENTSGRNPEGASSGNPTESENFSNDLGTPMLSVPEVGANGSSGEKAGATGTPGALSSAVPETNAQGTPKGVHNPGKVPLGVAEVGSVRSTTEKENAINATGISSYPVAESNHPGTPTEHSSDYDAGQLPYSVPEENKKPGAAATSMNSSENGELLREAVQVSSSNFVTCSSPIETAEATAVGGQHTSSSSIKGSVTCCSPAGCTAQSGGAKKSNRGKVSESGGFRNPDKDDLQATPASSAIESSGIAAIPKASLLGSTPPTYRTGKSGNSSTGIVGQFGSPGPPPDQTLAASSNTGGGDLENATASPRSSSSKEAPHRKEKFLRDDSFPDSDFPTNRGQEQKSQSNRSARAIAHGLERGNDAIVDNCGENSREQEITERDNVNIETQDDKSCVVPIQSDPEDDRKGKERCDRECKFM